MIIVKSIVAYNYKTSFLVNCNYLYYLLLIFYLFEGPVGSDQELLFGASLLAVDPDLNLLSLGVYRALSLAFYFVSNLSVVWEVRKVALV